MKESRREFLKRSGGCALGMVTLATQMQHFGLMSALAQKSMDASPQGAGSDYKALVVIFFSGGNDGNNMVIPNHNDATISNYNVYANLRSNLAVAQNTLLPITVPAMGGLTYGLHPNLGPVAGQPNNGIHELWAQQKMAIVTNVGTLVRPTTKAQMSQSSHPKPYQLYSHSDQVAQFQTSVSNTQAFTGWGGRLSDQMNLAHNPNGLIPMVTSIAGAQLFTSGQSSLPMAINDSNTSLANVLNPSFTGTGAVARRTAWNNLRGLDLASNYIREASEVTDIAMAANTALQSSQDTTQPFPNTGLGRQLRQVARLIKSRTSLNVNRQVFYCQIGGFDTHSNQITVQANLFTTFSQAVRAFYAELVAQGIENNVTTFTLSDFGRTMNPAGAGTTAVGSDHAWGNHMFVIGGSVLGGNFYGMNSVVNQTPYPNFVMGGLDDADSGANARGRWIPTTSVEQYAATIARWFGLPQNAQTLESVFPNLDNFPVSNLGFMP
ncbi:MAG TPA: DUF1501 domain-containing protein [Pyrinomonadaceae bacterium]|nr:DUF1501 domain-containing protein [Pyrinomonadaceae bacterium]